MGILILPSSGPIYVDASGFIYSVERIEPYAGLLDPLWRAAQAQQFGVISSELTLLETLVKPFRAGDVVLEQLFRRLFQAREVRLLPATASLWEQAARLRAATLGLRTPDALHAATALAAGATLFVTNDPGFHRIPGLPVTILSTLLPNESPELPQ